MIHADLHVHSHHSDGTDSPTELVARAKASGIKALALTDHDMVTGVRELTECARGNGLEVVPGVEISTTSGGFQLHILGYYIDCQSKELLDFLEHITSLATETNRMIFENLCGMGLLDFTWEQVLDFHRGRSWIGSTDIFRAMKAVGKYNRWEEGRNFYSNYFGPNSPAYIESGHVSAIDAIKVIAAAGGIPVLAHPILIGDDSQIEKLVPHGLMGIEAYYPAHASKDIDRYVSISRKHKLLVTGGTDWHGRFTQWDVELGGQGINRENYNLLRDKGRMSRE